MKNIELKLSTTKNAEKLPFRKCDRSSVSVAASLVFLDFHADTLLKIPIYSAPNKNKEYENIYNIYIIRMRTLENSYHFSSISFVLVHLRLDVVANVEMEMVDL